MSDKRGIAPREAFEIHEILSFKSLCATEASAMIGLVKDDELKNILKQDFEVVQNNIRELRSLLQDSEWASDKSGTSIRITTH